MNWKQASLILVGIGFSNLGKWIYFVAINITVLNLTGSAAAVAGLFVLRPIAMLVTNFWAGSFIDRMNVKKIMVYVDLVRGGLILLIPMFHSLWCIYAIIMVIHIFGSFFGPSQSVYITKLISTQDRQRFNSIMSMCNSGAFLLGPALSGVLIMNFSATFSIYFNAISFFVCALMISLLPDVERDVSSRKESLSLKIITQDWKAVSQFAKKSKVFIQIYLLFQIILLICYSIDSQEATYIRMHLQLSEGDYGLIISLTGVGSLIGSSIAALIARKVTYRWYISLATLLTSLFYLLFYASNNFLTAAISFSLLGFCMSFSGSGYSTFFQNNVPTTIMGRFGSLADVLQGSVQIIFTMLIGYMADLISLQLVCLFFSGAGVVVSIWLCYRVLSIYLSQKAVKQSDEASLPF